MSRKDALNLMKYAGYHGDGSMFTRLYIENRVSRQVADKAYRDGAAAREGGMKCHCRECNPKPST